jgi:mannose-6-phosphate isomerase-like protein (cupin superfamily)
MTASVIQKATSAWPSSIREEFEANQLNGRVGTRLLSEADRVRVWELRLAPGERLGFHRHMLDYFWTAVTPGRARSHREDGSVVEAVYAAGDTRHFVCGRGEYKIHDLENVGNTDLWFITVEFLDSANEPLEINAGQQ